MQIGKQMNLSEFRRRPACEVRIGAGYDRRETPRRCAVDDQYRHQRHRRQRGADRTHRPRRGAYRAPYGTGRAARARTSETSSGSCVPTDFRRPWSPTSISSPRSAAVAAKYVDKVRINPGNYRTDHGEFEALIEQCRERGVALRIGVNHGSLAKRVFDEWGDTPQGMVVSAMEFLRVCRERDFDQVVVSMKSSQHPRDGRRLPPAGRGDGRRGYALSDPPGGHRGRATASKGA